jgi:hypothetical protein
MSKLFEFLKIWSAMLAAYIVVATVGGKLFMTNSPKLNMEYIASLREIPSYTKVQVSSLASLFTNKDKAVQKQVDELKKQTGAVEVAVSKEEQKTLVDSMGHKTNPVPEAVFNYVAKGVAVTAKSAKAEGVQEQVVLRIDPETNIQYRRFQRPDGTFLDVMIFP